MPELNIVNEPMSRVGIELLGQLKYNKIFNMLLQ